MRSTWKWLAAVIGIFLVLVLTCLGTYGSYWAIFRAPTVLTTTSPGGTYKVVLKGRADQPWLFLDHTVRFTLIKNDEVLLAEQYFHSGDALDPGYAIAYPQHSWIQENVVHFYRKEFFEKGKLGTVEVRNNSNRVIKYLRVIVDDCHLLFELQPGSTTKLTVPPSRGDYGWISFEGVYSDDASIGASGSFVSDETRPAFFSIIVDDSSSTVTSSYLRKLR